VPNPQVAPALDDIQRDLIFDLGMHHGEDTEFYLAKGFRVLAVEANPDLCAEVGTRLASAVADGSLTIVNRAIAEEPGEITFYENDLSAWGTVDAAWAARNRRLGSNSRERTVIAATMAELLVEHGTPYYIKIDIEGMDMVALRGFSGVAARPKFVSIESDKVSFRALRQEFETLTDLGYDRFKLVSQRDVPKQQPPNPPLEGNYVPRSFELGASGLFGDEAPGKWVSAGEAIEAYRRVFLQYSLTGDDPFIRSRLLRIALKAVGFRRNWFDTHAKLTGA
jgi:FkbM family methyltransferase